MKLIFDGDCAFCVKCANFGKARLKKDLDIVPWQECNDLIQYGLTVDDVQQRIYFINNAGKAIGGSRAAFKAGLSLKMPWPIVSYFFLIPGMGLITEPIYRFIARNRYRLPGGSSTCVLPTSKSSDKTL